MNNLKYLFNTLNIFGYRKSKDIEKLKSDISTLYNNEDVFITLNGRTAIYLFLKSLNLTKGDKVAIQAFTCSAVVNPILSLDLNPIYIDINPSNFNMSYEDFINKVDGSVKVVILQHTFGLKADARIVEYCKANSIYVLEDCAHTLGEKGFGTLGDAFMLSFGIEKLLPTRVGGALVVNNKELISRINDQLKGQKQLGYIQTFLWLIHPMLWRMIRVLPGSLSRILKDIFKSLGLLKSGFTSQENMGNSKYSVLQGLSGILARTAFDCLVFLPSVIQGRKMISGVYREVLDQKYDSYIRYPYITKSVEEANEIISYLESEGYSSRDRWFEPVVFPRSTNLESMKYIIGTCPIAEDISSRIVNLPTGSNVSSKKALEIGNKIMSMK